MQENCSICNTEVQGAYCYNCGQQIGKKDISFRSVIVDSFSSIVDVERSVLAGLIKIIRDPYQLIANYWHGNKRYYPAPGKLLIYSVAVAALHLTFSKELMGANINSTGISSQVLFWIVFLPLLTLTSYLTYIFREKSLTRHIVATIYVASGLFIWLLILFDLLSLFIEIPVHHLLVFLVLFFIWNARVFSAERGIGRMLLGVLIQILIFIGIVALIGFIFSLFVQQGINLIY